MSELWMNGAFVSADLVTPPALDGAAAGLFETLLVRDGVPVRLERHLARLAATAWKTTGVTPPELGPLEEATRALPARVGLAHGRMRIALTADDVAVTLAPFAGYADENYVRGAVVVLAPEPGHPMGVRAGRKLLPYTPLLAARDAAHAAGAIDVLFRAEDGFALEGAASNIFAVIDGRLRTPPLTRGVLPGVTRGAVLEAARSERVDVAETDIRITEFQGASEVFLTGSLMEVMPVRGVGKWDIPLGPLAPRLLAVIRSA